MTYEELMDSLREVLRDICRAENYTEAKYDAMDFVIAWMDGNEDDVSAFLAVEEC